MLDSCKLFFSSVLMLAVLSSCGDPPEGSPLRDYAGYEQLWLPEYQVPEDIGTTIRIEGGSFLMGAPKDAENRPSTPDGDPVWLREARPLHKEFVRPFEIGKYEVTAREYCEFLNVVRERLNEGTRSYIYTDKFSTILETGGKFVPRQGFAYAPALHVQLRGARRYCEWLSERSGEVYRLPSELEWEFAARGTEGRIYPWGEDSPVGRAFLGANYYRSYGKAVVPVGSFPMGASPEGVQDLIGNAEEWCVNCYYEYAMESIGADREKFERFVSPPVECEGRSAFGVSVPRVAVRGGQYVDGVHPATAWLRHGVTTNDLTSTKVGGVSNTSFRVLKEVEIESSK